MRHEGFRVQCSYIWLTRIHVNLRVIKQFLILLSSSKVLRDDAMGIAIMEEEGIYCSQMPGHLKGCGEDSKFTDCRVLDGVASFLFIQENKAPLWCLKNIFYFLALVPFCPLYKQTALLGCLTILLQDSPIQRRITLL